MLENYFRLFGHRLLHKMDPSSSPTGLPVLQAGQLAASEHMEERHEGVQADKTES